MLYWWRFCHVVTRRRRAGKVGCVPSAQTLVVMQTSIRPPCLNDMSAPKQLAGIAWLEGRKPITRSRTGCDNCKRYMTSDLPILPTC